MTQLKIVIFDCDGVMFDSKNANQHYYNHLLEKFQHPPMTADELNFVHMHNVMESVNHIFRRYPGDIEAAHRYRASLDYTPFLRHMTMEPDLLQFVRLLRPALKTAISTSRTSTMVQILKLFELVDYFDKVVTTMDVKNPKPHPEALHNILNHFGLSADEAVYIGDSIVDRQHTAAAGMRLIAFKNPGLPAEFHVNSFMEITRLPFYQAHETTI